ncbi:methyltransferase domain-containing protein [Streptantibioticus ferralitis]|uniref:Methyltransferase domain-containing protein n=1 Tax=Streptantibioticus ferralitis TaxID=236510 RepID=A0ABT5Z8S7_9ACTN|nr:methyltransferase domain-containing protein [Streptantibioticus ferralitis]MDF2260128.1 methyltransferase domain-containing protein [Streptantibioticus ferralitis]
MTTPRWDPEQYPRFTDERIRPLRELPARVPALPAAPAALDLGCGPGNSTTVIRERWPEAAITGVDDSAETLRTAHATGEPSADHLLADAAEYDPAPARPGLWDGQPGTVHSNCSMRSRQSPSPTDHMSTTADIDDSHTALIG